MKEHKQYHEGELSQKVSKLNLRADNIIQILALQKHLEQLMLIISNRCQRITYSEIKDHLEKVTRTVVSDEILLALFSVDPESYKFYETNQTICVLIVSKHKPITPKVLEERRLVFKNNLKDLHNNDQVSISLISLPKIISQPYVSARNTIINNIIEFSVNDEKLEQKESNHEFKSKMEEIKHKIKIKAAKKKMREDNFKKVDWQMKRLPSLARALNGVFVSEKNK